jgi:tight adherence protein B
VIPALVVVLAPPVVPVLVPVLLAAAAGGLAVPGAPRLDLGPSARRCPPVRAGAGLVIALVGATAAGLLVLDGTRLALALILLGCTAGAARLVRRSRLAAAAELRQSAVVEVCEALVGELRAGQPPVTALEHCVEVWPAFDPVAGAARLGADVPAALRRLAALPGAEGLREVAAAWQVSEHSGAGLATALGQVAGTARTRQATRHLVAGELASAQATARLVALLPVASLAMSAGIGGDPWHFLLGTPVGLACLGCGAAFALTGLWWIDRIAVGVLAG